MASAKNERFQDEQNDHLIVGSTYLSKMKIRLFLFSGS